MTGLLLLLDIISRVVLPTAVVVLRLKVIGRLLDEIIISSLVVVVGLLLDGGSIDDDELCCEVEIGSVVNISVVTFS